MMRAGAETEDLVCFRSETRLSCMLMPAETTGQDIARTEHRNQGSRIFLGQGCAHFWRKLCYRQLPGIPSSWHRAKAAPWKEGGGCVGITDLDKTKRCWLSNSLCWPLPERG